MTLNENILNVTEGTTKNWRYASTGGKSILDELK